MDTATGLLAVVPIFSKLSKDHSLISQSLLLAKKSPEINVTVMVDVDDKTPFYPAVLETVKVTEKKEGEKFRLVLVLNPLFSFFTEENIMECFQRLIVDALSDGIVAVDEKKSGQNWRVDADGYLADLDLSGPPALAIWKRDVLDQGIKSTKELRVLPYPAMFPI